MSYLFFAWITALLYGSANVIGKLTSKYSIKNVWYFNFLYGLFTLIFTVPVVFLNHVGIPTHWGNLLLATVFNVLFSIFYILSIYNLDISVMSPLFNFRTAFGVILAVLILREALTFSQIILIGIIFIAGIFVSLDEKFSIKSFFKKPVLYGILMAFFLAASSIYINKSVADAGYWETNLFVPLISQMIFLITIPLFLKDIKKIKIKQVGGTALMALCLAMGNITANKAYAANVSISTAIIALPISLLMVFFLSSIKPGFLEKQPVKVYIVRLTFALIMIGSALILSGWKI